ncbi:MAG: flagellar export protein FliJ [Planctomycetota bacterium]
MATKPFRLKTVQRLREADRDEARGRLAEAYRALEKLADQQATVSGEVADALRSQRNAFEKAQPDLNLAIEAQRFLAVLRAQQSTMEKQSGLLQAEIEKRRAALAEADRNVRLLEKLEEKHDAAVALEQNRAENAQLDEAAGLRHRRFGEEGSR